MSATFETELRRRAEAAVPSGLTIDPHAVLAAGRRRQVRRTSGALGVAAALALGGLLATQIDVRPHVQPAAQPHSIGRGATVEVAPGVVATNALTPQPLSGGDPRAGTQWWDTWLVPVTSLTGQHYGLWPMSEPVPGDTRRTGVYLGLVTASGTPLLGTGITWPVAATAHDDGYVGTTIRGTGDAHHTMWIVYGHVPSVDRSPRALLVLPSVRGPGNDFVEVPTFRSPVDPNALLYALTIDETKALGVDKGSVTHAWVVLVAADGTVDLNGACAGESIATCLREHPGLDDALRSVGGTLSD